MPLAHLVLTRTTFGRYVYAIGGNEEATRLSGVAVRLHKTAIYGVSGPDERGCRDRADGAAQFRAADRRHDVRARRDRRDRDRRHQPDAAAEGSLAGTLVGALIMGVLRNGLNLLGVSSFLQQIVIGGVIVGAVLVDTVLKRHRV